MFATIKKFLIQRNIIKSTFTEEGFVYVEKQNGKFIPTANITDTIKALGIKSYYGYYKNSDKMLIEMFELAYPEYKGYIWLW
jgi:hypothetical protein